MTDDERLRRLAYSIWESEGRPEGQQQRHWDMALKIVAAEQAAGEAAHLEDSEAASFDELPYRHDKDVGQNVPVHARGKPSQGPLTREPTATSTERPPGPMEPLPEASATAKRSRHRIEEARTSPKATDLQVPGTTNDRARSGKASTTAKTAAKASKTSAAKTTATTKVKAAKITSRSTPPKAKK